MDEELLESKQSKRPKTNAFFQQTLWAWQPILTIANIYPYFYIIGILFIPFGAFFFVTSTGVKEHVISYTECKSNTDLCSAFVKNPENYNNYKTCNCSEVFELDEDFEPPVHMFYALTNFYQNHRRYVLSRDDDQLNGQDVETLNSNCEPYAYGKNSKMYAPCGAIAMSIFNDTFKLTLIQKKNENTTLNKVVEMSFDNIAWKSDTEKKFGQPPANSWNKTIKPVSWPAPANIISPTAYSGYSQLLVWMRIAALPNFRKNYANLVTTGDFAHGLPAGKYLLDISYAFPVTAFSGTKAFVISTSSWLGGRNPTLGIGYIIVGLIHLLIAFLFTAINCHHRKRARM